MKRSSEAFSLVEVVIALGITAFTLTAIIGLMAAVARVNTESRERFVAENVLRAAIAESERIGYTALLPRLTSGGQSPGDGLRLFFNREGELLPETGGAGRFFAVSFARIEPLSSSGQDAVAGFVAFTVQVEWPWLDDAARAAPATMSVMQLNHVVLR